jgi:cytochrome c-type biogenesis protein CcmH/NrfG
MKIPARSGYWAVLLFLLGALVGCARSPEAVRSRSLAAGQKWMQNGDYRRALLEFKKAVHAMPRDAESQYQLGNASAAAGDMVSAAAAYKKATELNPKHTEAQAKLARIMAVLGDRSMVEEAEKRLHTLLDASPADMSALNTLAFAELKLGNQDNAVRYLEEVLSKSPQQLGSSILLAQAKLEQKDINGAEEILKQACAQNAASPDAFAVMGRFYTSLGRLTEAEQQFQAALRIQPRNAPTLFYLGMLENTQ